MSWDFSVSWFLFGLLLVVIGGAIVVFYRWIADNLAGGVSVYEKVKFWGVMIVILGLVIMMNLHTAILRWLVGLVWQR